MATLLNGTDTNRLVEVLAGSTALLSDPTGSNALPLSLNSLLGDSANDEVSDATAGNDASLLASTPLDTVTTLLGDTLGSDAPTADVSDLLGIGDVLNLGTTSQLDIAGPDGAAQPVFDATNILVKDVHAQLEILSHETGTSDILHAVTNLGETAGLGNTGVIAPAVDGHTNLVTDIVNAPSTLLNSGLDDVIAQVGGDLGDTLHAATGLVGALLNGTDPINPLPDLIDGLGADLQTLPILNINGGTSAGDDGLLGGGGLGGGLLGGVVGDLTHSSSGHLIDVDAGPQDTSGLGLDLLAAPGTDATHTASVNAIDVGPNGPHLLDLGVLTGAGIINIPGLDGAGTDGLAGHLPGSADLAGGLLGGGLLGGGIASGNATAAPVSAPLDIAALNDLTAPVTADHGILDLHSAHIL